MMYRCTVREVAPSWKSSTMNLLSLEYKRNPISFIKTEIKKPEKHLTKKAPKSSAMVSLLRRIFRIKGMTWQGIRVVCAFIDDIYTIAQT